jgi:hypothetical protein
MYIIHVMEEENRKVNRNARALSKLGASKGGLARKAALTPEQRREIARHAVEVRWTKAGKLKPKDAEPSDEANLPMETAGPDLPYSMYRGTLSLGGINMECHVLSDLRRVLTQIEVMRIMSGGEDGNLQRYLDEEELFGEVINSGETIRFTVQGSGIAAFGYEATFLIEICETYLKAKDENMLDPVQMTLAKQAEIIVRACAKLGIIELIDKATGYQEVREKHAVQLKILAFIIDDMQEWIRMFPQEFWHELARLENVHYSTRFQPLRWGKYVSAFLYAAVDRDIDRELNNRTPNSHFRNNLRQWFNICGRNRMTIELNQALGVMKTCRDMDDFRSKFAWIFEKDPAGLSFLDLEDSSSLS